MSEHNSNRQVARQGVECEHDRSSRDASVLTFNRDWQCCRRAWCGDDPSRGRILTTGGYLYLTVLGFLTGMVVERIRFDRQRASLLQHLAATHERLHTHLMDLERQTEFPDEDMIAELLGGQ
jgi:hypothetical protein